MLRGNTARVYVCCMEITNTNIETLRSRKTELLSEALKLNEIKKKFYANVDIESPMSSDEKDLDRSIAAIFSEINTIVLQIRKAS